ncbi:NUDIX domain-containing protein [Bacillus carboniphilus]|uniref:NUDIX domain-containing protein n=1 Tax=Bacillus carboniphilus TaxID=86663 RepID=A0ABN0WHI6_9BACI
MERLKIFDENMNPIGEASREEVHQIGHWHEVFHCWFISKEQEKDYIYLQLRSKNKIDYPDLLDITAAGHLLAHETVEDGVREIHEELGVEVSLEKLESLGILNYSVTKKGFIDNEFAHVYLHTFAGGLDEFVLQPEEVAGIVKADFNEFFRFWMGEVDELRVVGFEENQDGLRIPIDKTVGRTAFVEHEDGFYQGVVELIRAKL